MPTGSQDKEFANLMDSETDVKVSVSSGALDSAIEWISRNLNPEDVFSKSDLESWAESNGYIKE